jgi:hypothetical protein
MPFFVPVDNTFVAISLAELDADDVNFRLAHGKLYFHLSKDAYERFGMNGKRVRRNSYFGNLCCQLLSCIQHSLFHVLITVISSSRSSHRSHK